jgi:hypothetical protein
MSSAIHWAEFGIGRSSMRFEPELGNMKIGGISIPCDEVETGLPDDFFDIGLVNVDEFMSFVPFGQLDNWVISKGTQEVEGLWENKF